MLHTKGGTLENKQRYRNDPIILDRGWRGVKLENKKKNSTDRCSSFVLRQWTADRHEKKIQSELVKNVIWCRYE